MLLSRFWYVLLALLLSSCVFVLYLAQSMYNRAGAMVLGEGLFSDSQVVSWYMRSTARERSAQLIQFALDPKITAALAKSAADESKPIAKASRTQADEALAKLVKKVPEEYTFDAVFAIDKHGRVVGQHGFEQSRANPEFELGGYPVVADALHGYIRDDTFVWDRMYMAVARPVENQAGELPIGAILGLRIVDDRFARDIAARTGSAIAFYHGGERVASGAPESFDRSQLDGIITDLNRVADDEVYKEKGRSPVRYLSPTVGVVYARMSGEAWTRGAGYVVARQAQSVANPMSFFGLADDKDKSSANLLVVTLIALLGIGLGMLFSFLEHTRPLRRFVAALEELASGKSDQLQASKVSGVYRKLVTQINDGIDHAVAKGGGSRRAADLQQVLGDLPDQPAMSAFSFPEPGADSGPKSGSETKPEPALPKPPEPRSRTKPQPPKPPGRLTQTMPEAGIGPGDGDSPASEPRDLESEWRSVYDDFVRVKGECGEPTESLTYEKFEGTLRKNRDAIVAQHQVERVKFTVYVKDGKAKLKANPIRD
jgi:hypothetical protein